jgi:transposase
VRDRAGIAWPQRGQGPTAAILDSQSVKSAERGGADIDPIGYDAGTKVKGIKRHIVVDTLGLLLIGQIQPANGQDRDGALPILTEVRRLFPFIEKIFADGAYQGEATAPAVARIGAWDLEIVKRSDTAKGFVVLPKRWIVERTLSKAPDAQCRRLSCRQFDALHRIQGLSLLRMLGISLGGGGLALNVVKLLPDYPVRIKKSVITPMTNGGMFKVIYP